MKDKYKFFILCAVLISIFSTDILAQQKVSLSGTIFGSGNKVEYPLGYAVISISDMGVSTTSNTKGFYQIKGLNPGQYEVKVTTLGYESISKTIEVKEQDTKINFTLNEATYKLDEVVVTAQSEKSRASTSTTISKTAMDHIQALSLSDIMFLLPGAETASKSDLSMSTVKTYAIRGGQSFGTSVIVDGAPISNNANMQVLTSATGERNATSYNTTPTSGIDFRDISTTNIESVEVINGIPSVKYGDITSGTVIVNSTYGKSPLHIKFKTNPNIYALSTSQGISLGEKKGVLNYGFDYTYSEMDPTESYDIYQKVNGRVSYGNTFGNLGTNSALNLIWSKNNGKPNPDDENDVETYNRRNLGLRLNTKGTYNVNKGWFKNLQYTASFSITDKKSYRENIATNAEWTYSMSETDNAVLSSVAGNLVYLSDGTLATNVPEGEEGYKAWNVPNSYLYNYHVYGQELNTYVQLLSNFSGNIGKTRHHITIGADYKNSGNIGKGKEFDIDNPPYKSLSYDFATQRERSYDDIPFINNISAFAEESFSASILKRDLNIVAGLRYDKVIDMDDIITPRINASYEIIPDVLRIRAGYGQTAKTPSLGLLYPDNAYFDLLNFDNSNESKVPTSQQFQIATTRVFNTENKDLKFAVAKKHEIGLDFTIGQVKGTITAYKEKSDNGYTIGKTVDTYKSVDLVQYKAVTPYPSDTTQIPTIAIDKSNKYLVSYTTPTNNYSYEQKGVDFNIDFGRINSIRTSFVLNGSWKRFKSWNNNYSFGNHNKATDYADYPDMGVYEKGNVKSHYDNITTNLIVTHNIPQIGFVVTVTANVIWRERSWSTYGNDSIPVAYISRTDGNMYNFDPSLIEEPEYTSLDNRPYINPLRYKIDDYMSPVLCMNVNITKEIKDFLRVSFFANNMFRSTPLWESKVYPGSYTRRNSNKFFFGLSLTATIK